MKTKKFKELTLKEYESFNDDIEKFVRELSESYHLDFDETEDEVVNTILSHFEC